VTNAIWPIKPIRDRLDPGYRIEIGGRSAIAEECFDLRSVSPHGRVMLTLLMIQLQSISRLVLVP
jgi:hypothetical protein